MSHQLINPPGLPKPRGFNHGVLTRGGNPLFLAGQDASDRQGQIVAPGDLVAQMEQALSNIETVVSAAGGTMRDVVQLTVFVRDRKDYRARLKPLGEVFRAHFGGYYPAMALFEVTGLFQDDALIELQGIAVVPEM